MGPLSSNWQWSATLTMRVVSFALTIAVIGAFFLPWIQLDGMREADTGLELIAITISPLFKYLYSVDLVQTGVIIGCPTLMLLLAVWVSVKYAQRTTAPLATSVLLASSVAIMYGAPNLVDGGQGRPFLGLSLILLLSAILLLHQSLIKFGALLQRKRQWQPVYRAISVITGSGYDRRRTGIGLPR